MDSRTENQLINAILDPVLLIDSTRRVVAANSAAQKLLGDNIEHKDLSHVLRHPDVLDATNATLSGEIAPHVSISLSLPMRRDFEIHISLLDRDAGLSTAVLIMRDVTALRGAAQMRADFVANVSHELRSPLSSLVGFIETLQGAAKDDAQARERFLSIMSEEAQRMARLIDDLLSLSGVQAHEHILPSDSVELEAMLTRIIGILNARADEKSMSIDLKISGDIPMVSADADQLSEVFHNLIENAIKYGRPKSVINVEIKTIPRIPDIGGAGVAVSVNDQSAGIKSEHLPRLTERFYRIDKGRSRNMGGTGLGLAIVKHIVSRHQGRLEITSEVGVGSQFTVYLPIL